MNTQKIQVIIIRSDLDNSAIRSSQQSIGLGYLNGELHTNFPAKLEETFHFGVNVVSLPVYGEKELFIFYETAKRDFPWIPIRLVLDADKERYQKPTYSCLSIGPFDRQEIEKLVQPLSFCVN